MIILRQLPYIDILSLNDMMSFDTKVNIIEHCKLARIDIPKSWRKAQIADALADIFTKDPLWTLGFGFQHTFGSTRRRCHQSKYAKGVR